MSLSLLNTYDSSDDSDTEDQPSTDESSNIGQPKTAGNRTKNFFIATSDSDQASDSSNSDNEDAMIDSSQDGTSAVSLPRPFDNSLEHDTSSVSVFRNPYLEAERAETVLLEQHVKLSETAYGDRSKEERRFKKSSLPCRQFRRGRCRMGEKCRFLHSAFPTATPDAPSSSTPSHEEPSAPTVYGARAIRYTEWGKEEIVDEEQADNRKAKKRRVGVTNSLIPPKRALASYEKQRREESPWMNS